MLCPPIGDHREGLSRLICTWLALGNFNNSQSSYKRNRGEGGDSKLVGLLHLLLLSAPTQTVHLLALEFENSQIVLQSLLAKMLFLLLQQRVKILLFVRRVQVTFRGTRVVPANISTLRITHFLSVITPPKVKQATFEASSQRVLKHTHADTKTSRDIHRRCSKPSLYFGLVDNCARIYARSQLYRCSPERPPDVIYSSSTTILTPLYRQPRSQSAVSQDKLLWCRCVNDEISSTAFRCWL